MLQLIQDINNHIMTQDLFTLYPFGFCNLINSKLSNDIKILA